MNRQAMREKRAPLGIYAPASRPPLSASTVASGLYVAKAVCTLYVPLAGSPINHKPRLWPALLPSMAVALRLLTSPPAILRFLRVGHIDEWHVVLQQVYNSKGHMQKAPLLRKWCLAIVPTPARRPQGCGMLTEDRFANR